MGQSVTQRRRYDSTARRQGAAQTRERIVTAGWELAHECLPSDWHTLTVRAIAERAEVNERTVYRHFASERDLRDAVMHRLEGEAGVTLEGLRLQDVADVTARVFTHVSAFPLQARTPRDPTLRSADQRRREALVNAVAPLTTDWPDGDHTMAAAVLDVLWSVTSFERLLSNWQLAPAEATQALTWAIRLVETAIHEGPPPTTPDARPG